MKKSKKKIKSELFKLLTNSEKGMNIYIPHVQEHSMPEKNNFGKMLKQKKNSQAF